MTSACNFVLGNGPSADGRLMAYLQPNLNILEFEKFRRLGELAYAEECKRQAFALDPRKSGPLRGRESEEIRLLLGRRPRRKQRHRAD